MVNNSGIVCWLEAGSGVASEVTAKEINSLMPRAGRLLLPVPNMTTYVFNNIVHVMVSPSKDMGSDDETTDHNNTRVIDTNSTWHIPISTELVMYPDSSRAKLNPIEVQAVELTKLVSEMDPSYTIIGTSPRGILLLLKEDGGNDTMWFVCKPDHGGHGGVMGIVKS